MSVCSLATRVPIHIDLPLYHHANVSSFVYFLIIKYFLCESDKRTLLHFKWRLRSFVRSFVLCFTLFSRNRICRRVNETHGESRCEFNVSIAFLSFLQPLRHYHYYRHLCNIFSISSQLHNFFETITKFIRTKNKYLFICACLLWLYLISFGWNSFMASH